VFKNKEKKSPFLFWPNQCSGLGKIFPSNFSSEIISIKPNVQSNDRQLSGLKIKTLNFRLAAIVGGLCLVLFIIRDGYLQIFRGDYYRQVAEENRFHIDYLPAERGVIIDRYNQTLVDNTPAFSLVMTIAKLPKEAASQKQIFQRVIDLAGLQPADLDLLIQEYSSAPEEPVVVKKKLDYEKAMLMISEAETIPGFTINFGSVRHYNTAAVSLSHLLGYTGKISREEFTAWRDLGYLRTNEIGKIGIEKEYETALRGKTGKKLIEVDAAGEEKTVFSEEAAVKGAAIKLSIDSEMQQETERALANEMSVIGKTKGVVIVSNPQNGEILTMVNLPSFDSNLFAGGIDNETYQKLLANQNQPLFSRAVLGEFPSGSTFKPYIATAALTEGVINASTSFLSTGGLRIGQWFFPDWKAGGHGAVDVRKALAESVNTFFYIIGGGFDNFTGLGVEKITSYAALFGFGTPTGIDLPNEADGFLPSKEWKEQTKNERWYVGDTYHLSIGQGDLLVTPIQIAAALNAVANGGTKYTPRLTLAIDDQPTTVSSIQMSDNVKSVLSIVREGMRQCVTMGSCRRLASLPISSAGKTGTAQIGGTEETHAWYTGFAPFDNPQIAVTVLIEEGGQGSSTAIVVAEKILQWWYQNRYLIESL